MQLDYHQTSVSKMSEFVSPAVNVMMDTAAKLLMEKNRKVIESLLKITMLCGKQGLPLRGHRDDGVDFGQENGSSNQGNYIELVHFRAETDEVKNAPRNALYTSKTIQNSLIEVVRQHNLRDILSEVNQAKYYTIIADEVTDLSNKEQLSLALRYVLDGKVKEVFVDFIYVERITGEVLAQAILRWHGIFPMHIFVANVMMEHQAWQVHGQVVWQLFSKKPQKLSTSTAPHTV